jgi:hypothetical protein
MAKKDNKQFIDLIAYRQLEREVKELKAQLCISYHFAHQTIDKASIDRLLGSGVLLELTGIGGKEIISPVMILNGLSKETIEALKADFKRSYDYATEFKV